ncbi:AAA family ATPase [Hyphococcus sp.]|uniref:AAA family ATPase n=1 Tax=Hyphococcus sp. TaxID=2038636 RepID=UPI00208662F9|nr:MAG: hypothetical protein DHS20C04_14020 [Marinicaulis sp.]
MYEQFFGLTEKPFSIQPDPSFLYWGRTHRLAYAMLEYGVLNHAGISVITGEVGCGKTTLIHRLLDQLSDTHTVALLSNVQEGRGDLLSWLLMSFGQPFSEGNHVALFSQLQSFFISEYAKGKRIVLIIDEAQNLSMDMLEELRLLSNINAGKDQLLQLILVGQPQLKGVLNRPELLQLTQRVGSDFHLTPLSREEVHSYIETRLSIAGCRRRIFTERAIDLIAEQSRGVPRVINVIADTALVYAFSAEDLVVGVETIRNVIRDKKAYGVFGMAAEEPIAPPIAASDEYGPDAFIDDRSRKGPRSERAETYEDQPDVAISAKEDHTSSIPVKTRADVRTEVTTRMLAPSVEVEERRPAMAEAASAPVPTPNPVPKPVLAPQQEMPITQTALGVVIVGTDPRVSPEAAIRSAPEGAAIVFAPVFAMNEASSVARKAGIAIVDPGKGPQTTGRALNAGYRQLKKLMPQVQYVQFLEANCVLDPDWTSAAAKFMERRPEVAIIEGRAARPNGVSIAAPTLAQQRSLETPGEIVSVRANAAFIRADAFESAGGFRGDLLSCEMDDLCVRQRRRGAHIWRLESGMMIQEMRRIGWWRRAVLRGFDNAYAMSLHGGPPERRGVGETVRAVFWGVAMPLAIIASALVGALAASMLAPMTPAPYVAVFMLASGVGIYILRIIASTIRRGPFRMESWREAFGAVIGRFAEASGVFRFWFGGDRPSRG